VRIVLFANTEWYLFNFRLSLIFALREAGHEVLLLSPPGPYARKLQALGFRWQPVPMRRRSLNPVLELYLFYRLLRILRKERPALVHAFTLKCAIYGALAARLSGVPARVNAVAGMGYVFTNRSLLARALRPVVRVLLRVALGGAGSRLILQNPADVALFDEARLVDMDTVRLIPGSGVDSSKFFPSPGRREGAGFRVLLPARLLWDKGVGEFVAASRILRDDGRDIEFVLAGAPDRGNPASVPLAQVNAWVAEGVIQWLGHVDDMAGLMRSVDVVVLPSYREGLPKGLIEAAACAIALVTTDVPGCRDVVTDSVDGLLVPPRNAPALAEAIARLHDEPGLALRLGTSAREKALATFDQKLIVAKTLAVYAEIQT
jgi:glycosyltransferase involved in cell wall biosynthesis